MPDSLRLRPLVGWILFASVVFTAPSGPVAAQGNRQQRVLALYVTTPGAAGATSFDAVYQKVLGEALGSGLDFHSEFIDLARFSGPDYPRALADFLFYKYQRLPPDLILAPTEGARAFVERFRAELFPQIPVVFIDRAPSPAPPGPGMTGIHAALDLGGTLDLALALQPATRQVFVVNGVSEFDRFYERLAHEQLERFAGRVRLTYLSGLPLAELERTVAQLPRDSLVYYLTVGEDGAGARFRSPEVRKRLVAAANVPMYAWNAVAMGDGSVGGRLYTNDISGERSAELALRILRGEKAESIPVLAVDATVPQVDWRQLRRWGISEARVPQGTSILFRELNLWDRYKAYIAGAVGLMIFQSALIAGLLLQRGRRRRMEAALRESEERFRFMADTAPVMIWLADADRCAVFFNQRWLDFRGRHLDQEIGDGWTEGLHAEDAGRARSVYAQAFDARRPFHTEYRLQRFDGEFCWLMDTGVPRFAQDGTFAGYIGSCIEITDIKRAEKQMRENQETLEAGNKQISDLFGRLIAAQETERTRIARDLHDDVSQRIAGLSIMLSGLKRSLTGHAAETTVAPTLASLQHDTIALAEEIRNLSHDLHPGLLQHAGLVTALSVFCSQFGRLHAMVTTFDADADIGQVDADSALCLYRVVQEALHNVAKHAGASRVDVVLRRTGDGVQLSIADDGKGFNLKPTRATGSGLGLISIDERVRLLRGSTHIQTQPGSGTRVEVRIPQPHDRPPDRPRQDNWSPDNGAPVRSALEV